MGHLSRLSDIVIINYYVIRAVLLFIKKKNCDTTLSGGKTHLNFTLVYLS